MKDPRNRNYVDNTLKMVIKRTMLSKHIWELKNYKQITAKISWRISKATSAYDNNLKMCKLCLEEKITLMTFRHKLLKKGQILFDDASTKTISTMLFSVVIVHISNYLTFSFLHLQ